MHPSRCLPLLGEPKHQGIRTTGGTSIALSALRWDQPTRDYVQRRVDDGKTRREAVRCLKRYIARELYPIITHPARSQPPALLTAA